MTRAREAARLIGNNTFRLDSNNAVGFNSTTPDAMFDINHGLTVAGVSTFTGNVTMSGDLTVQGTTTTLDTNLQEVDLINVQANAAVPAIGVTQSGSGPIIAAYDGASEVFRVDDGGSVAIGTDSADRQLHVKSTNGTVAHFESSNVNEISQIVFEGLGASAPPILGATGEHLQFTTNNLERLRIVSGGNIGIGETTPLGNLHIKSGDSGASSVGSAADELVLENSTDSGMTFLSGTSGFASINFADSGDANIGQILYSHASNYLAIKANDLERLRITGGGSVGINTTSPSATLEVASTGEASINIVADSDSNGSNNDSLLNFRTNGNSGTASAVIKYDESETNFGIETNGTRALSIDTSQRLLQGKTSSKGSTGENVPTYCTEIANTNNPNVLEIANNGTASGSYSALVLSRSDGTSVNSHTAVDTDDKIGEVCFIGADGSDRFNTAASIFVEAEADFTANDCPARLILTTNGGSASATERLRIDSRGSFQFSNGFMNETVNINSTARNGTQDVNLDEGMVHYFTSSATGTWKPNFTLSTGNDINDTIATGDTFSVTTIVNKSNTNQFANSAQVDGSDITVEFAGGAPTEGGGNNTFDVYHYTIIKTGNDAFIAFVSITNYE